jgi:L-fucose isomerase
VTDGYQLEGAASDGLLHLINSGPAALDGTGAQSDAQVCPTIWFAPRLTGQGAFKSSYSVMNNWGVNHCVMTAGHVSHLYITLACMLRISVYEYNVDEAKVFCPSSWNAFWINGLEAADFRACATCGPLYK